MNYYFQQNNEILGPVSLDDLVKLIDLNYLVKTEDEEDWKIAQDVPEVFRKHTETSNLAGKKIPPALPSKKIIPPAIPQTNNTEKTNDINKGTTEIANAQTQVKANLSSTQPVTRVTNKSTKHKSRVLPLVFGILGIFIAFYFIKSNKTSKVKIDPDEQYELDMEKKSSERASRKETRKEYREESNENNTTNSATERKEPRMIICPNCKGQKKLFSKDCKNCDGNGSFCMVCGYKGYIEEDCAVCNGTGRVKEFE